MGTVTLPRHILKTIATHAKEGHPNEVCGILAGKDFASCRILRATNTEQSPVSYFMDPKEQLRFHKEMREQGEKMLAIYHSHPGSEAFPSQKDVDLAFYPDTLSIIISLLQDPPVIRAFSINEGKIEELFIQSL
ncbi:MAG: M67 family metallopeptidase [bacterium]